MDNDNKQALLDGIAQKGQKECKEIKALSDANAANRLAKARTQVADILKTANQTAENRVATIKKTALSSRAMMWRQAMLEASDQLNSFAVKKMFDALALTIQQPSHQKRLLAFLVEGTLALSGDAFIVNTSQEERVWLTAQFFDQATTAVQQLSGRAVTYKMAEGEALHQSGLIVEAFDKTMLYDNTFKSRFMRYQQQIRMVMASKLVLQEGEQWNG